MRKGEKMGLITSSLLGEFEKFIKRYAFRKTIVYDNYYGSLRDDVEK